MVENFNKYIRVQRQLIQRLGREPLPEEIAEILNVTPKTVENHIALALKYISRALESYKKRGLQSSIG